VRAIGADRHYTWVLRVLKVLKVLRVLRQSIVLDYVRRFSNA
jgi:hypothetical protein